MVNSLLLMKQTTYYNILFYYLSMSSLQNKTKYCLRDKLFFTLAKSNCTYFVRMGLKYLTLAYNNVTLLQSCPFKTC